MFQIVSLVLGKGEQAPLLLFFPAYGSFSHVPLPEHLVSYLHGVIMVSGWANSPEHHCSISQ